MNNEAVSKIDWKEVGITATVTLFTAAIAVLAVQTLIIPGINKLKEKRAASKEKDAAKK
ncbi:MAG: hypothetical protein JST26_05580 [Bacteroidetes bacterium]|nr:hypothetical protein [Bacteroidota bacterium]